jgi:hypothetical protein
MSNTEEDSMMNVVDLDGRRESLEFGRYVDLRRAFRSDIGHIIAKHAMQGCTPSMLIQELIDVAKHIKKDPPPFTP